MKMRRSKGCNLTRLQRLYRDESGEEEKRIREEKVILEVEGMIAEIEKK